MLSSGSDRAPPRKMFFRLFFTPQAVATTPGRFWGCFPQLSQRGNANRASLVFTAAGIVSQKDQTVVH